MNGNLIDTNIIIKLLGGDREITAQFEKLDNIHIPVIVVGELSYGANKSSRRENNMKLFSDFIGEYPVLNVNAKAAEAYGKIKYTLAKQGMNIPENDLWIAAIAVSADLRLITCDQHFAGIPDMQSIIF